MTFMNLTTLVVCLLTLGACQFTHPEHEIHFRVTNQTASALDLLRFSTADGQGQTAAYRLPAGASLTVPFRFADIDKTDGSYHMTYVHGATADTITREFGYYTNGHPLDKELVLDVFASTVRIGRVAHSY